MVHPHGISTRVIYQKQSGRSFIVMASSQEMVKKWRGDKTIALIEVVDGWVIFTTSQGAQGHLDHASASDLENEFGTRKEEEVIKQILEQGSVQEQKGDSGKSERFGSKNDSQGGMMGH